MDTMIYSSLAAILAIRNQDQEMGAVESISAKKIVELGLEVFQSFKERSFWGKMMTVLSSSSRCSEPKINDAWQDSMREYFLCLTSSQHREIYEALAIFLILTFLVLVLCFFTIVMVVVKKNLTIKSTVQQSVRMVNINEIENGRSRSRRAT